MNERNKKNKTNDEKKNLGVTLAEERGGKAEEEKPVGETEKIKEPAVETPAQTSEEKIQAQLEEKTKEATENFDKWLRLRAEFENYKKRVQREKADSIKFGSESLLKAMLPALDNLARAIDHGRNAPESDSLLEGVAITHQQFLNILEKFGVKAIQAAGEIFNPEQHEAIAQEESEQEPNRVIAEVERGYLFHDRLLRPAKVIVSKAKTDQKIKGT
ncbi:MAG: nucleotide exchange factor GrpE [Pseudomonadota bacterium]